MVTHRLVWEKDCKGCYQRTHINGLKDGYCVFCRLLREKLEEGL